MIKYLGVLFAGIGYTTVTIGQIYAICALIHYSVFPAIRFIIGS